MGCTHSKLNKDICQKDETTKMHIDFIKQNGLDAYYAIMSIENEKTHNSFVDNSSNETDMEIENLELRETKSNEKKYRSKRKCTLKD